jgi:two-component system, OmpR family, sensor histidine kinase VicK
MFLIVISVSVVVALVVTFIVMRFLHVAGSGDNKVSQLAGALKSKEAQAEILIESISDGIILTDTDGRISLINKAASEMTGWPIDEAMNLDARVVLRLLADEKTQQYLSDAEHPISKVVQSHNAYKETIQLVGRKQNHLFVSLVISPVIIPKNNEFVGTIAVFRDVSKEKSEEEQRAEFISTASHEMRTPVAAIEGYLALALNDKVSSIDARAREYLEKAHSSTQHLGKLFQDLLTSAKAEDGRLTSHPVIVEMSGFIEQLAEDLRFSAQKKGLAVEFIKNTATQTHNDKGLIDASNTVGKTIQPLYYVNTDPDRLREVITNLFDNAVKYTESGKVSLGITGDEKIVQIRVQDTGPGIPATDLPHLFQKFYRVDNSATRAIGGTGLGLFISRKIIELYNGSIWAESTVGEGSTFYINLPRIDSQQAQAAQPIQANGPDVG